MGTKQNPGRYDCYEKAAPDEPMFILLARDRSAPELVELWARERELAIQRGERPVEDRLKVAEAMHLATDMRAFRRMIDAREAAKL